ncbi:hypothetical protein ES703_12386 [subsurface metagenome]
MFNKLLCLVLVLCLVGSASAALPQGWQSQDINTTGGSASESGGTWTISGDGADIWDSSDAFHYAFVPLSYDGQIVVRVVDNGEGTNDWAKGGLMIRESLEPGSKFAAVYSTTPANGVRFQKRAQSDSAATSDTSVATDEQKATVEPVWLKLERNGNEFNAYYTTDLESVPWISMSWNPQTVEMSDTVYIGLAVTSHQSDEVRTFTFDNVSIELPKIAMRPEPADGSVHAETLANLIWAPNATAASHDVYFGDNFANVTNGTGYTFYGNQLETFFIAGSPVVLFPDGLVPGRTYYWRIDEVNDTDPNSPWKGDVWSFTLPPRTAYAPDPADAAESVDPDVQLSWTPGFDAKLHYVYFGDNFYDVNNAADRLPQGAATYTPGTLKLAQTYYWRVDEFDAIDTYKGDVWSFTTQGAVGSPDPANGAVDVKQTQIITWLPSVFAASHELYFGTDKDSVKNADTTSPEYKGTRALGSESYDPGKLEWNVTYYWRIDEFNNTNPDSPWTGILWNFTTANFLVVDDFESYNDLEPPDPGSNKIFESWLDGYEIPTNGALIGNELPPYAETSIVHGGVQSMPYFYDNSVGYSEATLTLTYPLDCTEEGVNKLMIWFRGDSANAAETLYVALNDSATVYHDNPNAALIDTWTEWTIHLQAFRVDLTNVNTITIGFGDKNNLQPGGSGTMYFDDILLYRSSEPEPLL